MSAKFSVSYRPEIAVTSYISTRGGSEPLSFADVLLTGLAPDGGLYVPSTWPDGHTPTTDIGYAEFAARVMAPFVGASFSTDELAQLCEDAYATFSHEEIVPFRELDDSLMLCELFWGPTLAFKDVAMQLLGRLFDAELGRRGERVTIVGATSGDTGSAAIEAFRDRDNVDIVIMHPHGRTSDVQRRQMTTVQASNVHNVALHGTFDDCQDIVKALFADHEFRSQVKLAAVNSINWARVMAQVVYYHWAAGKLGADGPLSITVPTGNFGNVFAGRVAKRMGAHVGELVVASNPNAILTQFFTTGEMTIEDVKPSLSPSMDIQVSSNLERLIFELVGHDGERVQSMLSSFRTDGHTSIDPETLTRLQENWHGASLTDIETLDEMRRTYETTGVVLDPHTAVGVGVARRRPNIDTRVVMATAHPAKFPDAVEKATGIRPALPDHLADLFERPEQYDILDNSVSDVADYVRSKSRA